MSNTTLQELMKRWRSEKPLYERLTVRVSNDTVSALKRHGVFCHVLHRTKDDMSLSKKLLGKKGVSEEAYEKLSDKSGVRVICRFKESVDLANKAIRDVFRVIKFEDKSELLDINQMGYQSLHFDVKLPESNDPLDKDGDLMQLTAEIQVRTLCQHAWAEIQHEIGYKPLRELPKELARNMYCLGALLEVADTSFSSVSNTVRQNMELSSLTALAYLEMPFLKIAEREYSKEFSIDALEMLLPDLKMDYYTFTKEIENFVELNSSKYSSILHERESELFICPYMTQPEIFLILYLLEAKPFILIDKWQNLFPVEDLQLIATWWGSSLADIS